MSRENTQKDVELAYARLSPSGEGGIGLFHVFGEGVETLLY